MPKQSEYELTASITNLYLTGYRGRQTKRILAENLLKSRIATYETRDDLVEAVSGGLVNDDGTTISAGGYHYKWQAGATEITDLPGLVPANEAYVEHYGAAGDGETIDTAAFAMAAASGRVFCGSIGKTYVIGARITLGDDYIGFEGNYCTIKMSTSSGHFDNTLYSGRYATNAVLFYASGRTGVFVRRARITTTSRVDPSRLGVIVFNTCNDIDISDNEIWGFSRTFSVTLNDCRGGKVTGNYLHDFWTNTKYEANGVTISNSAEIQITGLNVDSDCLIGSRDIEVSGNRFFDFTVGSEVLLQQRWQTDAINLQGNNLKQTKFFRVFGNKIYNVGDGLDVFGSDNDIFGNHFERCFNSAFKLVHGANRNKFRCNTIDECGYCGVLMGGSNSATAEYVDNVIENNFIYNVNRAISWYGADDEIVYETSGSSTYWSDVYNGGAGAITAGIRSDTSGSYQINGTTIRGNVMRLGGNADYGVYIETGVAAATLHYLSDNDITGYEDGKYRDDGGRLFIDESMVVSKLPAASAMQGRRTIVTDANATTFNSIVAGGGSNKVPVFSDGTNWRIG